MTKPKPDPWRVAEWDIPDASALQAIQRGDATPEQQRRALDWIVTRAAMTYDETFVPGQADVSTFLAGRRSVGLAIVKLLKLNTRTLTEIKK